MSEWNDNSKTKSLKREEKKNSLLRRTLRLVKESFYIELWRAHSSLSLYVLIRREYSFAGRNSWPSLRRKRNLLDCDLESKWSLESKSAIFILAREWGNHSCSFGRDRYVSYWLRPRGDRRPIPSFLLGTRVSTYFNGFWHTFLQGFHKFFPEIKLIAKITNVKLKIKKEITRTFPWHPEK